MSLVEVDNLSVAFGDKRVVDGVSFTLDRGETLALVGEIRLRQVADRAVAAATAAARRHQPDRAHRARRHGHDRRRSRRRCTGRAATLAGIVFQEPMTSLNPLHRIGRQVAEAITLHRRLSRSGVARPGHRGAEPGRLRRRGTSAGCISAPVVRRPAPAGHDRHGAGQRPRAADRRRADHRARCHHPGADPRACWRASRPNAASRCC